MLITILSAKCIGVNAVPILVEVDIDMGIGLHLVGLADAAVKESLLRTTTALQSIGLKIPGKRIIINLAPADLHKKGSGYDLPIALGIIAASGQKDMPMLERCMVMGELGLDGSLRYVPGALPAVELASQMGLEACILPKESAMEAIEFCHCPVYGAESLPQVLEILSKEEGYERYRIENKSFQSGTDERTYDSNYCMDFSEIAGQQSAKRGLEIAAAGGHNVIMIGAPGSGKSSLAKAMCKILPPMSLEESIQTSKIYSVSDTAVHCSGLIHRRPFRAPHSTASVSALIGGGSENICPGEVSLAHNGILFLDEFCEIPRKTIEILRAPLEDRQITISRLKSKVVYPANFTLIAATNPCPCGYWGEGDRCTCSVGARNAYLSKLSGPIMDRIDIQLWLHPVRTKELINRAEAESSLAVAQRVARAREVQRARFASEDIFCNAQMNNSQMGKYCPLSGECRSFLEKAMERSGLSARACTRIIKLARTIADLDAKEQICIEHLAEAVSYRFLDKLSNQGV